MPSNGANKWRVFREANKPSKGTKMATKMKINFEKGLPRVMKKSERLMRLLVRCANLLWICDDNFQFFSIPNLWPFFFSRPTQYLRARVQQPEKWLTNSPNEFQLITTRQNFIYCIGKMAKFICLSCTYLSVQTDFCFVRLTKLSTSPIPCTRINDLCKLSTNSDWKALAHSTLSIGIDFGVQLMIPYKMTTFNGKSPWTFCLFHHWKVSFSFSHNIFFLLLTLVSSTFRVNQQRVEHSPEKNT